MKKTTIIAFVLFFYLQTLLGQNIVALEYFIDQDPGYGLATPIAIIEGESVAVEVKVPADDLDPGIHKVYVRSKDNVGQWGHLTFQIFEVLPTIAGEETITNVEYFIDQDPGYGLATAIPFTTNDTIIVDVEIPTTNLQPGIHKLYVRSSNGHEQWSHLVYQIFEVLPSEQDETITFLEYFVDKDPGWGLGTPVSINAADTVSAYLNIDLGPLNYGVHKLYVRSRDMSGDWSLLYFKIFEKLKTPETIDEIVGIEYILPLSEVEYAQYTLPIGPDTLIDEDVKFNTAPLESGKGIIYARGISSQGKRGVLMPVDSFTIVECELVFNTLNDGNGSLRFALNCVNAGDTVHFAMAINNQILELQQPEISLDKDVVLWSTSDSNITLSNLDTNNSESLLSTSGILRIYGLKIVGKSPESLIITLENGQGELELFDGDLEKVTIENQ